MNPKAASRLLACWLALSIVVLALPAGAAEGGPTGTVTGSVTVAAAPEACIVLGVETLEFGTLEFGEAKFSEFAGGLTSCSVADQDYLVRGTDPSSGTFTWELSANTAHNQVRMDASVLSSGVQLGTASLSTENQLVFEGASAGATLDADLWLYMPDSGSDGAGETFSFDIVWTAMLSD